jgi:2-isopropylmalate synthase
VAYVGIICNGKTFWGVGIDPDIIRASIEALIVAVNKIEELGSADACTDARMIEIMNYVQANYIDIRLTLQCQSDIRMWSILTDCSRKLMI